MPRPLLAAALALGLAAPLALPADAFDITSMTPGDKAAFGAAVKDWLLANPEVLIEMSQKLEARQYADQAEGDRRMMAEHHDAIFADPASWAGGNLQGDITVVEFMDYRCGYCRKAQAEVEELVRTDGNIRFVVKELPILGEASTLSSKFAIAVRLVGGDAAYKSAHDTLMTLRGEPTEAALARLAGQLGLEAEAVMARMEAPEVAAIIAANRDLAQRLDIQGTPTFVVDDIMVRGYVPLDGMRKIVADARG